MNYTFDSPWLNKAANEIDAAMFSGDCFLDPDNIQALENFMDRWKRGLAEHKETIEEGADG